MKTIDLILEYENRELCKEKIKQFGKIKYELPMINSFIVEVPEGQVSMLAGVKGVDRIHQSTYITAQMLDARKIINAERAYAHGFTGKGVTVAILDTGVSPIEDFTKGRNRIIAFKDVINGKTSPYDDNGHGTHVAC